MLGNCFIASSLLLIANLNIWTFIAAAPNVEAPSPRDVSNMRLGIHNLISDSMHVAISGDSHVPTDPHTLHVIALFRSSRLWASKCRAETAYSLAFDNT